MISIWLSPDFLSFGEELYYMQGDAKIVIIFVVN